MGYSLSGAPMGRLADLIAWANGSGTPILALNAPSGFDATTGQIATPTVSAAATVTLALPKRGLTDSVARRAVGNLYLADIFCTAVALLRDSIPDPTAGFPVSRP